MKEDINRKKQRKKIIEFILSNGWIEDEIESNYHYNTFYKDKNINIDVIDDEIILIDGTGDFLHIEINHIAIYSLFGYLLHHRYIACDYEME